jgi:hypothetical protein
MYIVDVYPYHSISIYISVICIYRRKFRSQTSDIWTDGATEVGRVREEKGRRKNVREEKSRKEEDHGARKGRKLGKRAIW